MFTKVKSVWECNVFQLVIERHEQINRRKRYDDHNNVCVYARAVLYQEQKCSMLDWLFADEDCLSF